MRRVGTRKFIKDTRKGQSVLLFGMLKGREMLAVRLQSAKVSGKR